MLVGWEAAERILAVDGHPTVVHVKAHEDAVEAVSAVLPATLCPELPGLVQVGRPLTTAPPTPAPRRDDRGAGRRGSVRGTASLPPLPPLPPQPFGRGGAYVR